MVNWIASPTINPWFSDVVQSVPESATVQVPPVEVSAKALKWVKVYVYSPLPLDVSVAVQPVTNVVSDKPNSSFFSFIDVTLLLIVVEPPSNLTGVLNVTLPSLSTTIISSSCPAVASVLRCNKKLSVSFRYWNWATVAWPAIICEVDL